MASELVPQLHVSKMPKKYTVHDLANAINEVRNGAKIRETERKYNIPHATMMDKLKEKSSLDARKGPSTILTRNEEELLCLWLKAMAKKGIPVEPRQLLDAVEEILKKDGRPSPFTKGRPGRKWFELFLKRHPDISLRKPEALGIARSLVTERAIRKWHDDLKKHIIEQTGNTDLLRDPSRIINGDESGFQTNPVTSLVIGPKGFKDLYEVRGSNKECITVMVTFNAAGEMAPLCIVYPYERIPAEISRNVNPDWSLGRSKKGWMTSPVFYGYVANNLLPFLKDKNTTFPVLYLIDGHKSHISYEVALLCKDNNIILYSLLPNATHILQLADVSVFRPIKCAWKKIVSDWQKKTGYRTVTRAHFAPLIESALLAATKDVLQKGFEKCGIYPFNKENIEYGKCLSHDSRVIDKPCQFKTEHLLFLESMSSSSRIQEFRSSDEQWCGDESAKELFYVWKKIKNYILSQDQSVELPRSTILDEPSATNHPADLPQEKPVEIPSSINLDRPTSSTTNHFDLAQGNSVELPTLSNLDVSSSSKHPDHSQDISDELFFSNLDNSITSNHTDLMMTNFNLDQVDLFSSDVGLIETKPQLANNQSIKEVCQLQEASLPKPDMACVTPKASRPTTNTISPAFADCVVWPTQSPVKKEGKSRKKVKLPDAVGAGAWVEYWENQKKIKLLKEENKRKRLERKTKKEEELKSKQTEKKAKEIIKKKRKKKEQFSSSEDEDNNLMEIESHSDFDDIDLFEPRTPTPTEELMRDPLKDDYALVKFPFEAGNKEAHYIGKILRIQGSEISVSCLRKSKKCENKFIFPNVPDTSIIERDQIVYILKPTVLSGTKRQQSCVSFDINLKSFNVH